MGSSGASPLRLPGTKVVLRDFGLDDLETYGQWLGPGHEWQTLDGPYYPRPDAAGVARLIERVRQRIEAGEWPTPRERLAIADATSDRLVGMVSRYWQSRETDWLSVGVVLFDPTTWRQGLGYEALGLWCDHLWTALPELVRLDLRTWSGNVGMMRLAEKLGFEQEACFRKARRVQGRHYDGLGYGVLREEWAARYPEGFPGR